MKFCFVDRTIGTTIWRVIEPIAEELIIKGHDVEYVFFNDGNKLLGLKIPEKVKVFDIVVPIKNNYYDFIKQQIIFSRKFKQYLIKEKPEIVHTNFAVPSILARWVAFRLKVPYILSTQHEMKGSMSFHYRWGLRITEFCCSAIIYVSKTVASSFGKKAENIEDLNLRPMPVHVVIPNGLRINEIRKAIDGHHVRIPGKIVCAGRMVPVKGQSLLLMAMSKSVTRNKQLKLKLIGSGPTESDLKELTNKLNLTKNVEFTGWLPYEQVLREMASAELVVVPSSSVQEGFGLVVAEGLICGTPLLVSDIPLFHEVLDEFPGRSYFFKEGNINALVNGIDNYFSDVSSIQCPLRELNEKEISILSAESMAGKYLTLYKRIISGV